jgi:predicted metal-dependent hydrolase
MLPPRLERLAKEKGFEYNRCTVRNVHSRWGSCNAQGNISLSIYLAQLPDDLIDYVLLHELCHTVEMNHSERFWALMDKATAPAKAKDLRKKLKGYRTLF